MSNQSPYKGILDRFAEQKAKDDANQKNEKIEAPQDMSPEEQQAYKKEVLRLREAMAREQMPQYINKKEVELQTVDVPIKEIKMRRAFCPNCGEELTAIGPVMYQGMTGAKMCIHRCAKCKTQFNLEFSYPRLVVLDENDNEVYPYTTV